MLCWPVLFQACPIDALHHTSNNLNRCSLPPMPPQVFFVSLCIQYMCPCPLNASQVFFVSLCIQYLPPCPLAPLPPQLNPLQYTDYSDGWHSLEPLPPLHPLIRPKPRTGPPGCTIDELWCPMLAGVTETRDIIPPRIHYVGNTVTKYIAHYPPHYRKYDL